MENKYQEILERITVNYCSSCEHFDCEKKELKKVRCDCPFQKDIDTLQKIVEKYQEIQKVYFKNEPMESADLNGEKLQELYNFINKLLDKDTPKKTKTKMNEHNHIDRHCPICDSFVYSFDIYCGKCGQRIRSEEE